jgi:hypothetical protein
MRMILAMVLGLVLAPSAATAACASGTLCYFPLDGDASNPCSSDVMSPYNGGPLFVSSPSPPSPNSQWPGTFVDNDGAYYDTAEVSGFNSLNGSKNFVVDFADVTSGYTLDDEYVDGSQWLLLYTSGGSLVVYSPPINLDAVIAPVSAGVSYWILENWSAAGISVWIGTSPTSLVEAYSESTPLPQEASFSRCAIGVDWASGYFFNGYIAQYRISSVTRTSWPSDGPPPTPTPGPSNNSSDERRLRGQ